VNETSSRRSGTGSGLRRGGGLLAGLLLTAVVVVAAIGWLSVTGRLAGLQYANIPIVHPYPPAGQFVNPFTGDPRDLVSSSDTAKVKADFLADGKLQLDAYARGDPSALPQTATGRALVKARDVLAQNTAHGVLEQDQVHLDRVIVGRLADPNDSSIDWCVREVGSGTLVLISKTTGRVASSQPIRFDSKYWMSRVGDRYLITDVLITTQPATSG
jgi:hypothetical protein